MPVYEYECLACKNKFERKQSFADEPVKICPECGGTVRKLFSRPAIVFKGSGWYVTDSRGPAPSEGGGETTKSETKTETKSETKSESGSGSTSSSSSTTAAKTD